ncbi:MAG: hypothetical protein IJT94_08770, partial [Oscillibacter sp.]|nr:hypothetical protein [Oscillibacter sp.]
MASFRARGYSGYHGRTPFWKILLATILAAVILASGGLLFLQRSMSFDSYGRPYFENEENAAGTPGDLEELVFGEAEGETDGGEEGEASDGESAESGGSAEPDVSPVPPLEGPEVAWGNLRAYRVNAVPLTNAVYWDAHAIMKEGSYNAAAVTLKDETGTVFFPAANALPGSVRVSADTAEALTELTASSRYTIARICCFLDPLASNANVNKYGLKNTGTYIFFDGNDMNWTDPGKQDARYYLYGLAQEAAALGFDEILLTSVGYPTEGKLDKIAYGSTPIGENLSTFLRGMREYLEGFHVKVSVEVPKALLNGQGDASG